MDAGRRCTRSPKGGVKQTCERVFFQARDEADVGESGAIIWQVGDL